MQAKTRRIALSARSARSALAVAAAISASSGAFAQSNVVLYGIVSQDVISINNTNGQGRVRVDDGALNNSRLGFKGSEDLGDGLSGIFDLESGFHPDTGTANGGTTTFWSRGAYVGLKGAFGTLTAGRHWNINDDLMGNFFIYGTYAAFRFGGFGDLSNLFNNSVKYVSPTYSGFSVEALGAVGENAGPRVAEIAGAYKGYGFKAALSYHENSRNGLKDKLISGGASYAFGDWNGRLGLSSADYELSGTDIAGSPKAGAYDVGIDYAVNAFANLSLDYVARKVKDSPSDSDYVRLLASYNFSKRTQFSVNLISFRNKGAAVESFYTVNGPGKTQNLFSAGMSHAF